MGLGLDRWTGRRAEGAMVWCALKCNVRLFGWGADCIKGRRSVRWPWVSASIAGLGAGLGVRWCGAP